MARCGLGVLGKLWVCLPAAWHTHTPPCFIWLYNCMRHISALGQGMVLYGGMGPPGTAVCLSAARNAGTLAGGNQVPAPCLPSCVGQPLAVHVQEPMQHVCCTGCAALSACCCLMSAVAGWMTHPAGSQGGRCVCWQGRPGMAVCAFPCMYRTAWSDPKRDIVMC